MFTSTLEVAHTYAPDRFIPTRTSFETRSAFDIVDTPEADEVRRLASSLGGPMVRRVALIDDVLVAHAQRESDDSARWQMSRNATTASVMLGAEVEQDDIFFESKFEDDARRLIDQITAIDLPTGYRLSADGRKIIIGSGKDRRSISLCGYKGMEDPTFPSCEMLDLAWLVKRLDMAPRAVTLLTGEYRDQQARVDMLADLIGIDPASHNAVFYPAA